jgi:iron complex outermembrane recepter protein
MERQMMLCNARGIRSIGLSAASAFALIAGAAPTAVADEPRPPQSGETRTARRKPIGLEELTVTARKRAERLQDTPVAVSAFSSADLKDADIRRINDISNQVPNLSYDATTETSGAARVNLRGVGNGDPILSDDPGVGIYLDGVYLARAQGTLFTVSDVERVEVLRGPQGTLFGKNTIGGAVNVITRKPELDDFFGTAEVRVGNYRRFDTRLSLNLPVVDERAAARLSFATATADGFTKNKGTGSDLDDDKLLGVRGQLLALPTDSLEVLLSLDHSREDRKPRGYKCKVSNPFPVAANAMTRPDLAATGTEFRSAPSTAIVAQQVDVRGTGQQLANLATGANPFLDACAQDELRDTRSVDSDLSYQREDLGTSGATATLSWSIDENLSLRSISSWRRQELEQRRDFDATGLRFVAQDAVDAGGEQQDQLSQELQLTGRGLDGRLSYVAGLFWFSEKNADRGYIGSSTGSTILFPSDFPNPSPLVVTPTTYDAFRLQVENRSYAAFGQGTYDLTDRLSLTLGARLTAERKRARRDSVCQGVGLSPGGMCAATGQINFAFEGVSRSKEISPITTLKYELSDAAQVYASWSRGFKSGGFNGRADSASLTNELDDEKLTSYELGFKTLLFDDRLRVNGAFFHDVYEDIQLSIVRGNATTTQLEIFVTNAGRAEINGAELELRAIPTPGLELFSTAGVTHARYTEFDAPADPADSRIPDDPEDRSLPNTPAYTLNVGMSYLLPLGSLGDLRARSDWSVIGRSGADVVDSRTLRRSKHGELDAQLAWMLPDGRTELVLFGSNLLDREHVVNGIDFGASFGNAVLVYNAPRTYGLEVRRSF